MSENIFYFRGSFPDGLGARRVSPEMVADLKMVAQSPMPSIHALARELNPPAGFVSRKSLTPIVAKYFASKEEAEAVERTLWNLSDSPSGAKELGDALSAWRLEGNNGTLLSEEDLERIKIILPVVTSRFASIARWRKANRVAGLTGLKLADFQLVCDLRPVFDEDRNAIEGVVPTTTLRLGWESAAGLPEAVEVRLTPAQIADLTDKFKQLERKVETITSFAKEHRITVPDLTRAPRGDAS